MSNNNNNNTFNVRFPAKQPTKKSIFERQRAEAEAKRQREEAETAAIYEDFVKSFDDGGSSSSTTAAAQHQQPFSSSIPQPKGGSTVGTTGGRRHFSIPSSGHGGHRNSGPGSLGGGSNSNSRYTDQRSRDGRPSRLSDVRTRLAFGDDDDDDDGNGEAKRRAGDSEEEGQIVEDDGPRNSASAVVDRAEEKATSKPTIRLANMPPGTSPAAVKALVVGSSRLSVDAVRILPSSNTTAATDRKSIAAIVTLAADTAASDIDAAVSAMQNRYLGFGYYLSLHRHLSSAVVAASSTAMAASAGSGAASQPFGARPVPPASKADSAPSTGFAPPGSFQGGGGGGRHFQGHGRGMGMTMGIPPPATYNSAVAGGAPSREGILHVPVRAPRDIKKLRMIHKVIEHVLDQGPEFEALLMSRPEVQLEEKWAWLWDARCEAGVWYRYRLWETVTGLHAQRDRGSGQTKGGKYVPLFEGSYAWKTPDNPLPYEFDTSLAELVSDSDYNSSDDSDAEAEVGAGVTDDDKETFLNPLEKARLTHLLARMPTTLSKLRKGDVARVTAFAITHASRGANEIVDLIVANVERPLAYTAANAEYRPSGGGGGRGDGTDDTVDTSGAQLIAVYVISDILSSSATSGIRHAWRFRQLFDAALRRRNVFASLGGLAEKFRWGRLRAEKWKRSIGLVLGHWEGWSVFSAETQAFLVASFENPPAAGAANDKAVAGDIPPPPPTATAVDTATSTKKSRWKTVDTTASTATDQGPPASGFRLVDTNAADAGDKMHVDSERDTTNDQKENAEHDDDEDDEWAYRSDYTDDEALDLACMDDEDIDGEPLEEAETRPDGIPLTADEIRALVGDMDEMSEEGEIATDDEDEEDEDDDDYEAYGMSGLSSLSDSDNGSDHGDNEGDGVRGVQGGRGRDVAMHDAPLRAREATATTAATTSEARQEQKHPRKEPAHTAAHPADPLSKPATRPTGILSAPPAPSGSSSVQASSKQASPIQAEVEAQVQTQVQASSVQTPQSQQAPVRMRLGSSAAASSAFPPRKRMRAADMFDDSDDEGTS